MIHPQDFQVLPESQKVFPVEPVVFSREKEVFPAGDFWSDFLKCPHCKKQSNYDDEKMCSACGYFLIPDALCPECKEIGEKVLTIKGTFTHGEPATTSYNTGRRNNEGWPVYQIHFLRRCEKHGVYRAEKKPQ